MTVLSDIRLVIKGRGAIRASGSGERIAARRQRFRTGKRRDAFNGQHACNLLASPIQRITAHQSKRLIGKRVTSTICDSHR